MNKAAVLQALQARLNADAEALTAAQRATQEGAFHEDNQAEDDKDTRAIEASYLARGLAERVVAAREAAAAAALLRPRTFPEGAAVALTALVELEDLDSEARSHYFLSTIGGGLKLDVGGESVRILTPASPLGHALVGRRADDEVSFESPQGARTYLVVSVE